MKNEIEIEMIEAVIKNDRRRRRADPNVDAVHSLALKHGLRSTGQFRGPPDGPHTHYAVKVSTPTEEFRKELKEMALPASADIHEYKLPINFYGTCRAA